MRNVDHGSRGFLNHVQENAATVRILGSTASLHMSANLLPSPQTSVFPSVQGRKRLTCGFSSFRVTQPIDQMARKGAVEAFG
jgi:hypothetical protein